MTSAVRNRDRRYLSLVYRERAAAQTAGKWDRPLNFRLANPLEINKYRRITDVGPEESDIINDLKSALMSNAQIVFEASLREFAAMVGQFDLFVCCDSGPMDLACAVGARVVAIFHERVLARWVPPTHAARAVNAADGVSPGAVLSAALEELALTSVNRPIMWLKFSFAQNCPGDGVRVRCRFSTLHPRFRSFRYSR